MIIFVFKNEIITCFSYCVEDVTILVTSYSWIFYSMFGIQSFSYFLRKNINNKYYNKYFHDVMTQTFAIFKNNSLKEV